jgi:hypothetical protein
MAESPPVSRFVPLEWRRFGVQGFAGGVASWPKVKAACGRKWPTRLVILGTGIIPNNYMFQFDPHPTVCTGRSKKI